MSVWPDEELVYDFENALLYGETRVVGVGAAALPPITSEQVAEVVRWQVDYHGSKWEPGQDAGSELSLHAVLRLVDGQWAAIVAGNDYTGWGCQDWSDVRVGPSEADVVRHGLDHGGRLLLGYDSDGSRADWETS